MQNQLNKIRKIKEKLELEIQARNDMFANRSEHWQESEAADEFENKTYELESALNDLNTVIDSLANYVAG